MKFMGASLLVVLVLASTVAADCTVRQRVVNKVVVATPVVAVLTPVVVASYGASYQPNNDNSEILKLLKAMNDRMDRIEKGQAAPAASQPAAKQAPGLELVPNAPAAVITAKCAKCHQSGGESKGGGFTLLAKDGSALRLDDGAKWRVMRNAYKGVMPPAKSGLPALTDAEVTDILEYLDSMK